MKFDKRNILIAIIVVLLIVLIILLFILIPKVGKKSKGRENSYIYNREVVELPGTKEISNDALSSDHCIDGVCIYDATIHYVDNRGRVDFKIKNTTNKIKTGYLKLDFGNDFLITFYKSLPPKTTVEKTAQYANIDFSEATDFKVKQLTKKEIEELIKKK